MGSLLPAAILVTNVLTVHMRLAHLSAKNFQSGVQYATHRWKRRETSGVSEVTCIFYVVTLVCGFIIGFLTHVLIEADEEAIEILEDIANDEEIEKAD